MQANEAIERLRAALRDMVSIRGNGEHVAKAREVLAATATIDPAPVGACCNNNCNQGRECPERSSP